MVARRQVMSASRVVALLLLGTFLAVFFFIRSGRETLPHVYDRGGVQSGAQGTLAIVAACRDRHQFLRGSLATWVAAEGVDEIVVVDWSSTPPLLSDPVIQAFAASEPRLHVVRVENESSWALSRAVNVAMRVATSERFLKLDCDTVISNDFVQMHPLSRPRMYYAGDYRRARVESELHLNGVTMVSRSAFSTVGGYDERLQRYGWDDTDFYVRLNATGYSFYPIKLDLASHLPHNDRIRESSNSNFGGRRLPLEPQTRATGELLALLPPWNATMDASNYEIVSSPEDHELPRVTQLRPLSWPLSLEDLLPPARIESVRRKWAFTYLQYAGYRLEPLRVHDDDFIFDLLDLVWERSLHRPIMTVFLEGSSTARWRTVLSGCAVAYSLERYIRYEWRGGDPEANRVPGNLNAFWTINALPYGGEAVDHIDPRELEPINTLLYDAQKTAKLPSGAPIYARHLHVRPRGKPLDHPAGTNADIIAEHCLASMSLSPAMQTLMETQRKLLPSAETPTIGLFIQPDGINGFQDVWSSVRTALQGNVEMHVIVAAPGLTYDMAMQTTRSHINGVAANRIHVISNNENACANHRDSLACWQGELADLLTVTARTCSVHVAGNDPQGELGDLLRWFSINARRPASCDQL